MASVWKSFVCFSGSYLAVRSFGGGIAVAAWNIPFGAVVGGRTVTFLIIHNAAVEAQACLWYN